MALTINEVEARYSLPATRETILRRSNLFGWFLMVLERNAASATKTLTLHFEHTEESGSITVSDMAHDTSTLRSDDFWGAVANCIIKRLPKTREL